MKEFRVILLAFFTLVAARMLSELPSCPGGTAPICGNGLIIVIPYLLATYFVDSLMQSLSSEDEVKKKALNFVLCLPYLFIVGFVVVEFLTSISVVTIEYILSLKAIYAAFIYGLIYAINSREIVRKLNTVFMASLILSFAVFMFL